jgi:hypothetical protein
LGNSTRGRSRVRASSSGRTAHSSREISSMANSLALASTTSPI